MTATSTTASASRLWDVLTILARLSLGGMFVVLAVLKLVEDPMYFAKAVNQYQVLPQDPPELINAVTITLPWIELTCGVAVLLGVFLRGAAALMLFQLLAFTPSIYMYGIKLFNEGKFAALCDINFDCGCGTKKEFFCTKIAVNLGLILASWILLKSRSRLFCLSRRLLRGKGPTLPPSPAPATGSSASL